MAGETRISRSTAPIDEIALRPRRAKPLPETLEAIAEADLITLGPGSLFTSVIPNLLVNGIPQAIAASRAVKAYFVNLMSQPGETTNFRASDHVAAMLEALRARRGRLIDVCVVNTRRVLAEARWPGTAQQRAQPVENDLRRIEADGREGGARWICCA